MFASCNTKNLELVTKTEYPELGDYARFIVHGVGDYEEMASDVDKLLSLEIAEWKEMDFEDREAFRENVANTIKYQMDNDNAIVYKTAVYHLNEVTEGYNPIAIKVNLGTPIHAYKKGDDLPKGYIKFDTGEKIDTYTWTLHVPVAIEVSSPSKTLGKLTYQKGYVLQTEKLIDEFAESIYTK